ncbi:MAG: hypothetical protein ACRDQI_10035 [Pseudonocardiaceae bacterium]
MGIRIWGWRYRAITGAITSVVFVAVPAVVVIVVFVFFVATHGLSPIG